MGSLLLPADDAITRLMSPPSVGAALRRPDELPPVIVLSAGKTQALSAPHSSRRLERCMELGQPLTCPACPSAKSSL